ncbi:MAG: WD40 repeat domain-containing protein [Methylococcaceae bacterium]|nr:WD40 repeat domain-containing protein [Methylococcaceae bacterium]
MSQSDEFPPCPYVGLQPFNEVDCEFFFGRDRDQRIISANLLSSQLTILYGTSGVGKSSLLMGGVIPYLRREQRRTPVVMFREWVSPDFQVNLARACIDAVWKEDTGQPKPAENLPLDEILRACVEAAHDTILVLFDQFEEYFLYHPKSSDPASFEAQFARAINREDVCAGFLIALREDSLWKLDRFRERIPNLLSNRLILKHLDETGADEAIRRPLDAWNRKYAAADVPPVSIEDRLVTELIDQVRIGRVSVGRHGGSGASKEEEHLVEAPFLQLVMTRLWAEEINRVSRELRLATLNKLGGAEEIVRKHLDDVMERLDELSQAVCASFFDRLITPTGSKVACSRDDLERWAEPLAPKVTEVLETLSRNRILRTVAQSAEQPNATSYEIYHDVLAPGLLSWRARYIGERQRVKLKQKADEAEARVREKEKNNRRLIVLICCLGAAFFIAAFIAHYAFSQKNRAMAFAAVGSSFATRERDWQLSALLALQAVNLARSGYNSDAQSAQQPRGETALIRALTNRMKWSIKPNDYKVHAVAVSPDGQLLATASGKQLHLWDAKTGQKTTAKPMEHANDINDISFTVDGNRLVAGDDDGNVHLWEIQTGDEKMLSKPIQHGGSISAMAVGPANLLTTANLENGSVIFWNLETGDRITSLPLKNGEGVADLAFSPDGSRLAVGEVKRGMTTVWDVSKLLDIKSTAQMYTLPNWQTDKEGVPEQDEKMLVDAVAFSPNGQLLATGDRFNTANLWNAKTGVHLGTFWGHTDQLRKLAFSPPDGGRLATASADGTAKIWDTKSGRLLLSLSAHSLPIDDLAFSPDGNWLVTVGQDKQAKLWNVAMHSDAVLAVAFSPDDKFLATGSSDKTIKIWERSSLELVTTLLGHKDRIQKLAFSPDNKFLASASVDKTAQIWDLSTGKVVQKLQYKDAKYGYDKIYDLAYSANGKWLATGSANYNAAVWEVATGNLQFAGRHDNQVSAVAFSPDGKYLASSGWDGQMKIWEIPTGTLVASVCSRPKGRKLLDVNFSSPDGKDLVMATGTPEILVVHEWKRYLNEPTESESPNQIACKDVATPLPGRDRPIASIAQFTPDGRNIVTIGKTGSEVKIWDSSTGKEFKSIPVPVRTQKVNDVALSRDGNWIAAASEDMNFYLLPLKTEDLVTWGCARVTRNLSDKECEEYLGDDKCPSSPCPSSSAVP